MGQCNGYLSDCMSQEEQGYTNDGALGTAHTLPVGPLSPEPLCKVHLTSRSQLQPVSDSRTPQERKGAAKCPFSVRLTLLVHSQIVHKLCAGFSINSLSLSQFHPLLFQTEQDHKQLLHKSKLIRFAFLLFLSKSAWSLLPLYTD